MSTVSMKRLTIPDKITRELFSLERLTYEFLSTTHLDIRRDLWHRMLFSQEMIFHSTLCYAMKVRGPLTNWIGTMMKGRKKDKTMRYISTLRGYFQHSDQDGVLVMKPKLGYRLEVGGEPIGFNEALMRSMLGTLHLDPPRTFAVLTEAQLALPIFVSRGVSYCPPSLDINLMAKRVLEYNQRLVQEMRNKLQPKATKARVGSGI